MGQTLLPVVLGVFVGSLSGLVGIGGGVVLVPILLYIFNVPMHTAAGTSLSIVLPMSLVGAISHLQRGNVDVRLWILLSIGSVIGAWLGAHVGGLLPGLTLKKIFAFILLIISLNTLAEAYGVSPLSARSAAPKPASVTATMDADSAPGEPGATEEEGATRDELRR